MVAIVVPAVPWPSSTSQAMLSWMMSLVLCQHVMQQAIKAMFQGRPLWQCRWLGKGEPNEILLQGSRTDPRPPFHDYRVTVITSDVRNSGTDADVFANITGQL